MKKMNFWARDLDKAAALCKEFCPKEVKETIAWADEIASQSFRFLGHWEMERTHIPVIFEEEIGWDTQPGEDPEWVYAFNRLSIFVVLGKAWRYTGDEKYVQAFVKQMNSWLANVPFTEQAKQTTWRSIETGLRCKNILLALSLMQNSPLIEETFVEKINESLNIHAEWLLQAHGAFQELSNWGVLQDHGLFILGAYFDKKEWLGIAADRLEEELFLQVMTDGTHWEQSPLYHCEVLQCCLDAILVAERIGFALPEEFVERTYAMSRALACLLRPDGYLVNQSDSDEVDARDIVAFAALLLQDSDLKAVASGKLYEENFWDFADLVKQYDSLPMGKRPFSTVLEASGNSMLRGGNTEEDDFLHMHCGSIGGGHGHADLLHVDLVSHGQTILADTGRYTYVDGSLRKKLKSPEGHNTILVDDSSFMGHRDSWAYEKPIEAIKGEFRLTEIADYVSGSHLGYRDQGVLPKREIFRLGENIWVLWDTVTAFDTKEHRYQHLFHFGLGGEVELVSKKNKLHYQSEKASASFAFCGEQADFQLSKQPISLEYNSLQECDCISAEYSAQGFAQFVTVISTAKGTVVPDLDVAMVPVLFKASKRELPKELAAAICIKSGDKEWVVVNCHQEPTQQECLLLVEGYSGYGRKLVFNKQISRGICLAY